jgi:beta-lactamase class A
MTATAITQVDSEIRAALDRVGADASLHVRSLDDDREYGLEPDKTSVTASVYKIAVMLEVACQAVEGDLSLTQRVRIPADDERQGNGVSGTKDDVDMSVRDLALLMMQVSDNTATDTLQAIVGTDRINARLQSLGLNQTVVRTDCAGLIAGITADLAGGEVDVSSTDYHDGDPLGIGPERMAAAIAASPALAGKTGNTSTARDITSLLQLIWTDKAGPAESCAEVRRIMAQQFAPHRLSTAYLDGPSIAGKTGTLWGGVRNEVGVFDFHNGERYAVAVFLRQHDHALRNGAADAVIGEVARLGIDHLRALR